MKIPWILKLRAFAYVLNLARFAVLLVAAVLALLTVEQGQDLLLLISQEGQWLLLLLGVLLWAFSIWLWTRVLLDIRFPYPPVGDEILTWYRKHLPRLLSALCFLGVAANLYRAGSQAWLVIATIVLGVAFYVAVSLRRSIGRWLAAKRAPQAAAGHWAWADAMEDGLPPLHDDLKDALGERRGRIAVLILVLGVGLDLWGVGAPLLLGNTLNALFLLLLWGATLLPIGSLLTYASNKSGFPLLTLIFVAVLGFSLTNDNHGIRRAQPVGSAASVGERTTIRAAVRQWKTARCDRNRCPAFVVAATAGGGIRAAYWTAIVLSHLHLGIDGFDGSLFAVSGVSGGSVGAVVYRSAVLASGKDALLERVEDILSRDFLGPLSAGLLYPDFLQRFLPWPWFPDRAEVFERALEAAAAETLDGDSALSGSLLQLAEEAAVPALFLNSTWSNNGRRIVGATLAPGSEPRILYTDLIDALGYDIPLSTAAHNSARFPYVSPPGSWKMTNREGEELTQRLQDGGLFENFGAETALEILQIAAEEVGALFRPVVILISSDPEIDRDLREALPHVQPEFGYEGLTTIHTFVSTRNGRGAEAASRLQIWAERATSRGVFAHFAMCERDTRVGPPLGWALSGAARKQIREYLLESREKPCPGNVEALTAVRGALSE